MSLSNKMIHNHFQQLKEAYDAFQTRLMKQGKFLCKDTGIGYWGVTPLPETYEFFKRIALHHQKNLLDLGCGDGRIVLLASLFGIQAHGIEFDQELVMHALDIRRSLDLPHFSNTKIFEKNFFDHDLSQYNMLYISPDRPFHRDDMERKLSSRLQGKLIVHGWEFNPSSLKKEEEHIINGEKFAIYTK